jgi:hypothetical protein
MDFRVFFVPIIIDIDTGIMVFWNFMKLRLFTDNFTVFLSIF